MSDGDFRSTERSVTMDDDDELRIEYVAGDGAATVLKGAIKVLEGEIVDGSVMRARALDAFLQEQIADAKAQGLLFSLHLKATMMKVSDPIIFGHAVRAFFAGVFTEHHDALEQLGASPNNGLGAILAALDELPRGRGRRDPGRDRRRPTRRRRRSRWSTPTAGSRTCTCRAT